MPTTTTSSASHRIALIDQMDAEWRSIGRGRPATDALRAVARRDPALAGLVMGCPPAPPLCPTPYDLVAHMRRATGRVRREEAARIIRVLLHEGGGDPFIGRMLVQALLPGLITVAKKLQWGAGGDWVDGSDFFGELLSTAWVVITEWAGQDRPYAVLDLLSAIRCRARRQLMRGKEQAQRATPLDPDEVPTRPARRETDLEELARLLIELRRQGMHEDEAQVLYAQHVLGYTVAELATLTGRERRVLYARRDRGRRRLCA
jgi:DNA-directed RNA polymerase specialized sigma24 family protein